MTTNCQTLVTTPLTSHTCYRTASIVVEGIGYCRPHAQAMSRKFIAALALPIEPPTPGGLTKTEAQILTTLENCAPQTVTADAICVLVYGRNYIPSADETLLRAHISNLRRKVGAARIETVRGVGYRMAS